MVGSLASQQHFGPSRSVCVARRPRRHLARLVQGRPARRRRRRAELVRTARTCYDHLAGRLGVALAAALERARVVVREGDDYTIGPEAESRLAALGIDLEVLARQRRPLVRGCLDWSERELHVAGALGAALAARFFELGWIDRRDRSRAVGVTDVGRRLFRRQLAVDICPET